MKKIMNLIAVMLCTVGATTIAQTKVSQAAKQYRNVTANYVTGGTTTSLSGQTPAIHTNTDTTFTYFFVQTASDLLIADSIVKTSGYVRGTGKLQGCSDTANGGKWFTVRGNTTTIAGACDSVFSFTGTTSAAGVWYVPRFPFSYGRIAHFTDTTEVVTPKVTVWGKY